MTPTPQGAAPLPEALRSAADIEHWARADNGLRGEELRRAAACLRRLHALTAQPASPLQAGEAAVSAAAPAVAPASLSRKVREFLQEGINDATQGEDADIDHAFAAELGKLLAAPTAPQAGSPASYTHADVTQAHADGYKLGLAQVDRPAAPRAGAESYPPQGQWVSFKDKKPPVSTAIDDPKVKTGNRVLVTNNIDARDRMGRMSHVWFAVPIKSGKDWCAFDTADRKIEFLTHWFDPFADADATAALRARGAVPSDAATEGWLITYTNGAGDARKVISLHNSVADYRDTFPDATSFPLGVIAPAAPMSAQGAPSAWALVPREPDAAMKLAAQRADMDHSAHADWLEDEWPDFLRVWNAMLAAAPPAAQSAAPGAEQHHRDSAELRRLCGERDAARRERDECKVEMAGYAASIGHLSRLVDGQQELIGRAMAAMKALHDASKPTNESGGDFDATVPYADYTAFVDAHAALLSDVANSPVAAPVAAQSAAPGDMPQGSTGHAEADRVINRLESSDPDFSDCTHAVSLIRRLLDTTGGGDEPDAAILLRKYRAMCIENRRGDGYHLDRITAAIAATRAAPVAAQDAEDAAPLASVRQAIRDYHFALDTRQHGGVALDTAMGAIKSAMGMHWERGAEAAARAQQQEGGAA